MAARDPLPEPPPVQDDPQLRLFLERAAAVVAQCGGLNAESRLLLAKLAKELGISRRQAEPAIHTLLLETESFALKRSKGNGTPSPSAPLPPPLPRAAGSHPESAPGEPPVLVIDDQAVLQTFLDKAAYVLAQHGGWNPKTHVILSELARSMGITPREMDAALAALQDAARGVEVLPEPAAVPQPPAAPPLPMSSGEGPVPPPGSAPPLPQETPAATAPSASELAAAPKPKPQEVYCSYLHKAMDDLRRPRINPRREQRLIEQGVHKLGLSPVLARQLMCDVARQREVTVETEEANAAAQAPPDERVTAFLARARAIIAEQRGVTVAGQIKTSAAARELGLTEEEQRRAMALLQEGAAPRSRDELRRQERLAAFRDWVQRSLSALPRKIITPDVVEQAVGCGCDYHGLTSEDAEKAVREAASAAGMRFVSQQRAVDHLARLVAEKMHGTAVLYPTDRDRILAEGAQWGLTPQDVEAVIADQVEVNRRAQAAERQRNRLLLGAASILVVLVAAAVLGWRMLHTTPSGTTEEPAGEVATGPGSSAPESTNAAPAPDHWWDVDLSVAMTRAEVELHYLRPALANVRSHSPDTRGEAYEQIISGLPRALEHRAASAVLQKIVSGAYALDPAESAARRLRERLLQSLPNDKAPVPEDVESIEQTYAAVQIAAEAAAHKGASEERSDAMRRALGQALGFAVDAKWDQERLSREAAGALSQRYYRLATDAAATRAASLQPQYALLSDHGERYLDLPTWERLNAEFLKTLLSVDPTLWRQYQEPLQRITMSDEPTIVLQAVEILEASNDDGLRYYVTMGLMRRIKLAPQGQTPEEVAAAVRKEFGVRGAPAQDAQVGWRRLAQMAEQHLAASPGMDAAPLQLLEETAKLARLAAMGCVLSQGELGRPAFDQLLAREPLSLERRAADDASDPSANPPSARERIAGRYIDSLSRANSPAQRVSYLKAIVENSSRLKELEPQEAEIIAKYLLSPKPDQERAAIAGLIPQLGRWQTVRLATADLIPDTQVRPDLVQEVVGRLMDQEPDASTAEDWRQRARSMLMRSVLRGGVPTASTHPMDRARQEMVELYQVQAQAEGVAAGVYAAAATPTAILPAMIEQQAADLSPKVKREQDREFLARISHELTVAEYLGENDLRRLALLERIWLRLVAMEISQARSDRAAQADAIVNGLTESDRSAPNVFHQLREGQAALVRLWLLRAP